MTKNIAILGTGIAGVTAGYYLARQGHKISFFDQERYPAMRTSRANGGQISVSNSEVWNTFSNLVRAAKWLGKSDAPLLIRPGLSLDKISWLTKFSLEILKSNHSKNTIKTIKLGLEHRKLLDEINSEFNLDYNYSKSGIIHIYTDEKYFKHAVSVKDLYENNGCSWNILSSDDAIKIDPPIKQIKNICGAIWTEEDAVGDMHKFCNQLVEILRYKFAARFFRGVKIESLIELDDFDLVVICAGADSNKFAQQLNDRLDIYPVKGYSITIDLDKTSQNFCPNVSILDDQAKIVTSTLGDRLRVAGTAEFDGFNRDHRIDRIQPLLNWVHNNLPGINTRQYSTWACLRPMTPNMLPIVKQSNNKKFWYHTGHGHLGWTLSLATANQLSKEINS